MTEMGKWPKNAIKVSQRGVGPLEMQLGRQLGMQAFHYVLGPLTKMTQIGKWAKNAIKVSQRWRGAS